MDRQVYYRSIQSKRQKQSVAQKVIALVQSVRISMPNLGTRKLYHILKTQLTALNIGRDKLFRILRANHLLIKPKRSYHVTTDSHHRFRKHKNLISTLEIKKPEQVWVSDITYTGNRKNPSYLALVTDAYSKKIVGYNVSNSLNASGSILALEMAIKNRKYKQKGLIHHSDRGLQYCSDDYQEKLKDNFIKPSMTEQYDPYENAIAERINGILKQEFGIAKHNVDLKLRIILIKNAIKIYNKKRPHWSNNMLTPIQMHQQNTLKPKRYKSKNLNNSNIVQV
ncbi:IS3 family transposase [Wocania ichthyoenteri]|uniref:IS3 family transposase n=1 Tax=Wocania ichthyoenteri TaxID=1230531 RepID=UPI00053D22DD|nr:IS3 family transposase [Wocania ichthyoenteri]